MKTIKSTKIVNQFYYQFYLLTSFLLSLLNQVNTISSKLHNNIF